MSAIPHWCPTAKVIISYLWQKMYKVINQIVHINTVWHWHSRIISTHSPKKTTSKHKNTLFLTTLIKALKKNKWIFPYQNKPKKQNTKPVLLQLVLFQGRFVDSRDVGSVALGMRDLQPQAAGKLCGSKRCPQTVWKKEKWKHKTMVVP